MIRGQKARTISGGRRISRPNRSKSMVNQNKKLEDFLFKHKTNLFRDITKSKITTEFDQEVNFELYRGGVIVLDKGAAFHLCSVKRFRAPQAPSVQPLLTKKGRKLLSEGKKFGVDQDPCLTNCQIELSNKGNTILLDYASLYKTALGYIVFCQLEVKNDSMQEGEDFVPELVEDIDESDIEMVMNQTGSTKEQAEEALHQNKGDLVNSILSLS